MAENCFSICSHGIDSISEFLDVHIPTSIYLKDKCIHGIKQCTWFSRIWSCLPPIKQIRIHSQMYHVYRSRAAMKCLRWCIFRGGRGDVVQNRPLWPYLFNTWQDQTLCTSCKTSLHQTLSADDFELNVCTCPIYGPKVG